MTAILFHDKNFKLNLKTIGWFLFSFTSPLNLQTIIDIQVLTGRYLLVVMKYS